MDDEDLAEMRHWMLESAAVCSDGTYAAGGVLRSEVAKLFAHIDALEARADSDWFDAKRD